MDPPLNAWTPLHAAAHYGRSSVADSLIAAGADLEARDAGDCTPLHRALLNRQGATARLLVHRGADVGARDAAGQTPLQLALFLWAQKRDADLAGAIEAMVESLGNPNARWAGGATPLHHAALAGASRAVELLLAKGAEATTEDENGRTPLDLAVAAGHRDIAQALRAAAREEE